MKNDRSDAAGAEAGRAAVLFPGASFNAASRKWFRQGLSSTVPESQIQDGEYRTVWPSEYSSRKIVYPAEYR